MTWGNDFGNNFHDFLYPSLGNEDISKMGSNLKGKNLLLWEQILFLRVDPKLRREVKQKMA